MIEINYIDARRNVFSASFLVLACEKVRFSLFAFGATM